MSTPARIRVPLLGVVQTMMEEHVAVAGRSGATADSVVDEPILSGACQGRAVICPSTGAFAGPEPVPRHVPYCALLRTVSGTVWMLRAIGQSWTEERIDAAARFLCSPTETGASTRDASLGPRLAYALQVPNVCVLAPMLDRVESSQWEMRRLAIALTMRRATRGGQPPDAADAAALAAQVASIERDVTSALRMALDRFVGSLDAEILGVEPGSLRDTDLYNYLVQPAHRRNRLQLARTFPLFVRTALAASQGDADATIGRAVDAGLPLIKTLAKQLGVAPGAVRSLRGCTAQMVGTKWEAHPRALIALLNAIPADLRPDSAATWEAFNRQLGFAEQVFGHRYLLSPLALSWLRQAGRHGWAAARGDELSEELSSGSIALASGLRDAMGEVLTGEVEASEYNARDGMAAMARARSAADRYLAAIAPHRLIAVAQRYQHELAAARSELAEEMAVLAGTRFWPLLPKPYLSRDRSRVVVPLVTPEQLAAHGASLGNCLGGSHQAYYANACAHAEAFILALLDAAAETPLSTAEIRIAKRDLSAHCGAEVVQHTAMYNARPTARCRTAVREVMALVNAGANQQHLATGLRLARQRRRSHSENTRQTERLPMRTALRRAIGERSFDDLVHACIAG